VGFFLKGKVEGARDRAKETVLLFQIRWLVGFPLMENLSLNLHWTWQKSFLHHVGERD